MPSTHNRGSRVRHKILTTAAGILAATALLAGCGSTGGTAQTTSNNDSSSSAAGPSNGAPKVPNSIDTSKFKSNICGVLTPAQVSTLGIVAQGSTTQLAGGPGCRWQDTSTSRGKLAFSIGASDGLASVYYYKGKIDLFQETTIAGFPAVNHGITDDRQRGGCDIGVGTSDHDAWDVLVTVPEDQPSYTNPCPTAEKIATMMATTLKGGS